MIFYVGPPKHLPPAATEVDWQVPDLGILWCPRLRSAINLLASLYSNPFPLTWRPYFIFLLSYLIHHTSF